MSWWVWISFSAICAGIFLYPSRFNLVVAQQSAARGRSTGLFSALGAAIGLSLSMTIAALLMILSLLYIGAPGDFLGWLAVSWLILTAMWTIGTVPVRQAMADNDNISSKSPLVVFTNSLALHLLSPRFLLVFIALLTQFSTAPSAITVGDFIHLQLLTLALGFASLSVFAIFPSLPITWLKKLGQKMALRRPANHALIAGKSVKARYRKIAA